MKKVIIEPSDFKIITDFLETINVPFLGTDKAAEVKAAVKRATIQEIEEIKKEE